MVDYYEEFYKDVLTLSRLALSRKTDDVHIFLRRMIRKIKKSNPELAKSLEVFEYEARTRNNPLDSKNIAAIPVDLDSRIELLRTEYPAVIKYPPLWERSIEVSLEQIVLERRKLCSLYKNNLEPTRSALFIGPPGVGKSLAARWLSIELDIPLFVLDLSAVMSSFLGKTGNNVRNVLDYAKGVDCILLLDEFDAIAKRRDDATEIGELKRLVTVLLQEIEIWPTNSILLAATNHEKLLDPAIWRRFDMIVNFSLPTAEQRKNLLLELLKEDNVDSHFIDILSTMFSGMSFSDIERDINRIRRRAVITMCSSEELFLDLIQEHKETLDQPSRIDIAISLAEKGLSQRKVSTLTGVSRDTIRKKVLNR